MEFCILFSIKLVEILFSMELVEILFSMELVENLNYPPLSESTFPQFHQFCGIHEKFGVPLVNEVSTKSVEF